MILESDFLVHWKTVYLKALLNDDKAPLYVLAIWLHLYQRQTDTLPSRPEVIASIAHYQGDGVDFVQALTASGFFHRQGGNIVANDFRKVHAKAFANWENGPKGGRPSSHIEPDEVPEETQPEPNDNPNQTHKEPVGRLVGRKVGRSKTENLPFASEDFAQAWDDFKQMRIEKRSTLTERSICALFKKLSRFDERTATAMLVQSVENGYLGVFDLKAEYKKKLAADNIKPIKLPGEV